MTNEEKDLLFKDLCVRFSYGVKILDDAFKNYGISELINIGIDGSLLVDNKDNDIQYYPIIDNIKPYLRPMSSMTEKELEEYMDLIIPVDGGKAVIEEEKFIKVEDFYNQHLLDYRGLIPKGLALEAKEGMYNIENI